MLLNTSFPQYRLWAPSEAKQIMNFTKFLRNHYNKNKLVSKVLLLFVEEILFFILMTRT